MTVQQIAELVPNDIEIELSFNGSAHSYNKFDQFHAIAFGDMVVNRVTPYGDQLLIEIKVVPERQ